MSAVLIIIQLHLENKNVSHLNYYKTTF